MILAALGAHSDLKHVVVVAENVNVHDPEQVESVVVPRLQPAREPVGVSDALGSALDPTERFGASAEMGLDATEPLKREGLSFPKTHIPRSEKADLARDLVADTLPAVRRTLELREQKPMSPGSCSCRGRRERARFRV